MKKRIEIISKKYVYVDGILVADLVQIGTDEYRLDRRPPCSVGTYFAILSELHDSGLKVQ